MGCRRIAGWYSGQVSLHGQYIGGNVIRRPLVGGRTNILIEESAQRAHVIGVAGIGSREVRAYEEVVGPQFKLVELLREVTQCIFLRALVYRAAAAVSIVVQQLEFVVQPIVKRDIALDTASIVVIENIFFTPPGTTQVEGSEGRVGNQDLGFIAVEVNTIEVGLLREVCRIIGTVDIARVVVAFPVFGFQQREVYLEGELVVKRLGIPQAEVIHRISLALGVGSGEPTLELDTQTRVLERALAGHDQNTVESVRAVQRRGGSGEQLHAFGIEFSEADDVTCREIQQRGRSIH